MTRVSWAAILAFAAASVEDGDADWKAPVGDQPAFEVFAASDQETARTELQSKSPDYRPLIGAHGPWRWRGDGESPAPTRAHLPPEPPNNGDSSVPECESELHAFFTMLLADPALPVESPETSAAMVSDELWRGRYGPLGAFIRMTDPSAHQIHVQSVRGALVTSHAHVFESWFRCIDFVGCRLVSRIANSDDAKPGFDDPKYSKQELDDHNYSKQEAFWRPFLELDGQDVDDPFLVVPFATLKSASIHPEFDELNHLLRIWMNWIIGWKLDLIILQSKFHVPWDVGFKSGSSCNSLDYLKLFSTLNNSALESVISKYPMLLTHFHLQTFNPTSSLRILLPDEPTLGLRESFANLRQPFTSFGACPVPVLYYLPFEKHETPFELLPHILLWWQFELAWYDRKRPASPRRDSIFLSSTRVFTQLILDFASQSREYVSDDTRKKALGSLRRNLNASGLGHLRIVVGCCRSTAEHLHEIGHAFVVVALDRHRSAGQVVADSMLMGTLVIGEAHQTSHS